MADEAPVETPAVETPEPPVVETPAAPTPEAPQVVPLSEFRAEIERRVTAETRLQSTEKPAVVKDEDPIPDPKEYEGREAEFMRDLNRWDARKTATERFTALMSEHEAKQKEGAAEKTLSDAQNNYRTQIEAEIAADPSLSKALAATANVPLTNGRDFFIASSPVAGKIAKHLAKTPGELAKYAAMPVNEALKYIGGLEVKLASTPAPVTKESKAPALHPQVEGPAGGSKAYKAGDGPEAYLRNMYPEMFEA